MGKTDPNHSNPYKQHSVILVLANTPGLEIERILSVMGFGDAPQGHNHITFINASIPASNIVLGEGRGFEIICSRLGPGRTHRAMRGIGIVCLSLPIKLRCLAKRALE
jgi:acyl-CoA dehydrogenase